MKPNSSGVMVSKKHNHIRICSESAFRYGQKKASRTERGAFLTCIYLTFF